MPKAKAFLKEPKKKSKHAPSIPETADEYLAAGVDFEEAGEKWRGGDAVKSTRFFVRALDCYEEALKKFPRSFDLAYNKARLQYELTQHPRLLQQLPGELIELLGTAVESSRYALKLDGENADVLFNTAQALTSYIEAQQDSSPNVSTDPLPQLEEALTLFQKCLTLQEHQHHDSLAQQSLFTSLSTSSPPSDNISLSTPLQTQTNTEPETPEERWASIIEPVTQDTLLDTLIAQLHTLTTLCSLLPVPSGPALQWVSDYAKEIIEKKLDTYCASTGRDIEAAMARDEFLTSFAEIRFRNGVESIESFYDIVSKAHTFPLADSNPEALVKRAEALISFHQAIKPSSQSISWTALTTALAALANAARCPEVDNLASVHVLRGDVEMMRWRMGREDVVFAPAVNASTTLLKNAEVFYRGGKNIALQQGAIEIENEGKVKEALVKGLREGNALFLEKVVGEVGEDVVRKVIQGGVEDGVLSGGKLEQLGGGGGGV